jgi:hypothetical protein
MAPAFLAPNMPKTPHLSRITAVKPSLTNYYLHSADIEDGAVEFSRNEGDSLIFASPER